MFDRLLWSTFLTGCLWSLSYFSLPQSSPAQGQLLHPKLDIPAIVDSFKD